MPKKSEDKKLEVNLEIVSREISRKAGVVLPDGFNFIKELRKIANKIGKVPVYVAYKKGKLILSIDGKGNKNIARVFREDGVIKGWSV